MKNKLRKIIIDNRSYSYTISNAFSGQTNTNTLTARIFLTGEKSTPLIIEFVTWDDPIMGHPLKTGFNLFNAISNTTDKININEPAYIRKLIVEAIKNGWEGTNKTSVQDGMKYLKNIGYDTSALLPAK